MMLIVVMLTIFNFYFLHRIWVSVSSIKQYVSSLEFSPCILHKNMVYVFKTYIMMMGDLIVCMCVCVVDD
jgi:hypothetical protein